MLNELVVVAFSRNRALQCDALIRSFYLNCYEKEVDFRIIYTCDPLYEKGYQTLISEHSNVKFIRENNFKQDLLNCVADKTWVSFLTDDSIFTDNFDLEYLIDELSGNPGVLGISLRLGKNTTWCYPYDCEQALPEFTNCGKLLQWDWGWGNFDFAYPLELSSSLYRVKVILPVLNFAKYDSPNSLEWCFYQNLSWYMRQKTDMLCYPQSVAFANPINKTQTVNNNRAGMKNEYAPERLEELYEKGLRINVEYFQGFVSNACHQEKDLVFTKVTD